MPEEILQQIEKKSKANKALAEHEGSQKSSGFSIEEREAREALKDKERAKKIEKKLAPLNKTLEEAKRKYSEALVAQRHAGSEVKKSKAADKKMATAGENLFNAAKAFVKAEISEQKLHLTPEEVQKRIVAKLNKATQVTDLHLSDKEKTNLQSLNEYINIGLPKTQRQLPPTKLMEPPVSAYTKENAEKERGKRVKAASLGLNAERDAFIKKAQEKVEGQTAQNKVLGDMAAIVRKVNEQQKEPEAKKPKKENMLNKATKILKNVTGIFSKRSGSHIITAKPQNKDLNRSK